MVNSVLYITFSVSLGCQLTKENNSATWSYDEEEDDDADFLQHTLFLRHVCNHGNIMWGPPARNQPYNAVFVKCKK